VDAQQALKNGCGARRQLRQERHGRAVEQRTLKAIGGQRSARVLKRTAQRAQVVCRAVAAAVLQRGRLSNRGRRSSSLNVHE